MLPRLASVTSLRTRLIGLVLLATLNGCGMPTSDGDAEAYVENGVLWAYGSVQLADLEGPGSIVLKRRSPDQTLDTPNSTSEWSLFGSMLAGDERDLAYVDFHPSTDRVLAYTYQLEVVRRAAQGEVLDVFAMLRKAGRSYFQRQRVFLGTAVIESGDSAPLTLAPNLKLSLIANGVFSGQWALHYPDVQKIVVKPWQGMCSRGPTQSPGQGPGQNPGQTPGQFDTCRPLPPEKDLCGGDPTKDGCRPLPPVQQEPTLDPSTPDRSVGGLDHQGEGVYLMGADVREAKMVFVSEKLTAADDSTNADLCTKKFYAVARTMGGRVNQACVLTPAPAASVDGKLACGLTIRFENAQTYLERVCDVSAVFKDGDLQKVQVLKK